MKIKVVTQEWGDMTFDDTNEYFVQTETGLLTVSRKGNPLATFASGVWVLVAVIE